MSEVDDEAFADYRVEQLRHESEHRWLGHDLPDEETVVGSDRSAFGSVHAERAAQPPVRRMQTVTVLVMNLH
jgi:hypothetical protein